MMDLDQFDIARNFKLDLSSKFRNKLKPGDQKFVLPETELHILQTERASGLA